MTRKWQQSTRRSQRRSAEQQKARAFLRKLDKLKAEKKENGVQPC